MLFVEFRFLVFFAAFVTLYWWLRSDRARKYLLLTGSYVFYAAWDWRFCSLLAISTIVDHLAAQRIESESRLRSRRFWLWLSIVTNMSMLGFFKYFNFFAESLYDLLNVLGISLSYTTLEITLPVGISFFTFQTLSYTIDVYRGKLKARRSLLDLGVFVAFFPQLVAGPIVRAKDFLPQLDVSRRFSSVPLKSCLVLFLIGFFKKAGVADNLAPYVDLVFASPQDFTAGAIWSSVLLYSVQLYADFSGYSDMAIAVAGLLGFRIKRNFAAPYFARNMAEYWERWHISLSTWLRDYVYFPLGGSRGGRLRTHFNIMVTFVLGGLWHGASWNFVLWGASHGVALVALREWLTLKARYAIPLLKLGGVLGITVTFVTHCLGRILFRAEDMSRAMTMLEACVTFRSPGVSVLSIDGMAVFALLAVGHWFTYRADLPKLAETSSWQIFAPAYSTCFAMALALVATGYRPFVYFQF